MQLCERQFNIMPVHGMIPDAADWRLCNDILRV